MRHCSYAAESPFKLVLKQNEKISQMFLKIITKKKVQNYITSFSVLKKLVSREKDIWRWKKASSLLPRYKSRYLYEGWKENLSDREKTLKWSQLWFDVYCRGAGLPVPACSGYETVASWAVSCSIDFFFIHQEMVSWAYLQHFHTDTLVTLNRHCLAQRHLDSSR